MRMACSIEFLGFPSLTFSIQAKGLSDSLKIHLVNRSGASKSCDSRVFQSDHYAGVQRSTHRCSDYIIICAFLLPINASHPIIYKHARRQNTLLRIWI